MKTKPEIFDFNKYAEDCVKCAKCVPTCTIHKINPDETTSPRGFIHLLSCAQNGELPLDRTAKKIFESCFLCAHCVSQCPSKVPTDTLIEFARAEIAKKFGIAWYKRAAFFLLRHRGLLNIAAKAGFIVLPCGFSRHRNGMKARFSMPFIRKNRVIPSVAAKSFLKTYPERMDFGGDRTVAVFVGCMANYAYTGVGDSLLYILRCLGINVFIPKDQLCCGAPSYFTGDLKTTKKLVKYNIEYFELFIDAVEAVIIPEATCSAMIIHDWAKVLANEPLWVERAERIAAKCFIASQFLARNTNLLEILPEIPAEKRETLTYHDPCHARLAQGVFKEPRALLKNLCDLSEMENSSTCCGFGGITIQTDRHALARAAGIEKARMIAATNARLVSAECSACRVQLSDALERQGLAQKFLHPLEIVAEYLRNPVS
ncbi:MAG: (Fe-S)-binding protein [Helicobacteraceae bacterium]|jgi:glycolate oxidase iron-sulfur subunit|nr:(Fe-S)-binding protein [Helicobacteraceae bacterium]